MMNKQTYRETFSLLRPSEDTLERVLNRTTRRKRRKITSGRMAAVGLAAALLLGTAAFAAEETGGLSWLADFFGGGLSQRQEQALEGVTTTEFPGQAAANCGITVTPEAEIYDGYRLFVRLRLDLEEGTELSVPQDGDYYRVEVSSQPELMDGRYTDHAETGAHTQKWDFSRIEEGIVEMSLEFSFWEEYPALGDCLWLENIQLYDGDTHTYDFRETIQGRWEVPLGQVERAESLSLAVSGLSVEKRESARQRVRDLTSVTSFSYEEIETICTFELQACTLTPLTLCLTYETSGTDPNGFIGEIWAVLADGTEIAASQDRGAFEEKEDGSRRETMNWLWEEPVNLEDLKEVRIGNIRVPVN